MCKLAPVRRQAQSRRQRKGARSYKSRRRRIDTAGLAQSLWLLAISALVGSSSGFQRPFTSIYGQQLQSNYTIKAITVAKARGACQNGAPSYPVVEASISQVQSAMLARKLTCSDLVHAYIQRIEQYDQSTSINAIRAINPTVVAEAQAMDAQLAQIQAGTLPMPPLFCVPLLVKDNYDTVGMAASNGAVGLLDNFPKADAHQIALLRSAGALVLAKTNMAEWAFSPDISIGSVFGVVRNPYDTDRSTAGSSGGTAAGIAANFGLMGLGTDTGNSIRGPAGCNALVGLRPSLGISSRTGVIPLDLTSDVAGPMGRTVEDVVRVFEATVGKDPADNLTSLIDTYSVPSNYTQFLDPYGLKGVKVGVLRQTIDMSTADDGVLELFQLALQDLSAAGATLAENFTIVGNSLGDQDWRGADTWFTGYGSAGKEEQLDCGARFKYDLNNYLATAGTRYRSVQDIVSQGQLHPSANATMNIRLSIPYEPSQYPPPSLTAQGYVCNCENFFADPCRSEFRNRLIGNMDAWGVSVIVFPTWSNPPLLIGDYGSPDGNNSPQISPPTGAPAMAVPMGFTSPQSTGAPMPASLQFLARPFDEPSLIRAAFAYEQYSQNRRPPPLTPECGGNPPVPSPSSVIALSRAPGANTSLGR